MKVQTLLPPYGVKSTSIASKAKIAYFILVHRFPEQFKRLFSAIYCKDNYYLIHMDKKADSHLCDEVKQFLSQYPNAYILESTNVVWGGFSMVQAELNGMNYLLSIQADWDYFINLSGQDFPLRSQEYIMNFLGKDKNRNFIKVSSQQQERPDTMNRIENHFTETETSISHITYKRPFMTGVTPYIGGQWMILNRACCDFICNSNEVKKFEDYYFNTLIADESFFQTVLMNTSYKGTIVNDDKRAIIWIPDGDIKLRPKTFTIDDLDFLSRSNCLFARKFDDKTDVAIINALAKEIPQYDTSRNNYISSKSLPALYS